MNEVQCVKPVTFLRRRTMWSGRIVNIICRHVGIQNIKSEFCGNVSIGVTKCYTKPTVSFVRFCFVKS